MAKKKSWFNIVKRFFVSETKPKTPEKKEKRRRWLFGRLKTKRYPAITAPTSSLKDRTLLSEAEREQSKDAVTVAVATGAAADGDVVAAEVAAENVGVAGTVAIATAPAANAVVVAAEVAAENVRVAGTPQSTNECEREKEEFPLEIKTNAPQSISQCEKEIIESAAIRIQTAFRGYLAKKALRALQGIVRLQALIRGRNVRRQAINTLKCLQSIVNIQTHVCAKRSEKNSWHSSDENKQLQTLKDKIIKMDLNSQRRWDDSTMTKEESDAMFQSRKEAILKRERVKEYLFQHRKSAESERSKPNGRWRYWLDQWVDTQLAKSKELEDLESIWNSNRKPILEHREKGLRLKNLPRQQHNEESDSPVQLLPNRSFHRKQSSLGDHENSFSTSPVVPTYMAATESAKAKARSLSSPRIRPGSYDTCSEIYSPYKNKLCLASPVTSEMPPYKNKLCLASPVTSEMPGRGRIGRSSAYQQRSPSLKGFQGPVKSSSAIKDLSINSESSFLNWAGQSALR